MKLQKMEGGSYFITVPKPIVRAKGWEKSAILDWEINEEGNLVLKEINR